MNPIAIQLCYSYSAKKDVTRKKNILGDKIYQDEVTN
jgi:hypothetical protein